MRLLAFGEILFDLFPGDAHLGGAPFNFSAHTVLQGGEATLLSAVGADAYGERARSGAAALGVDTGRIAVLPTLPTGTCLVELCEGGHSFHLRDHVAYDRIPYPEGLPPYDVFSFGTLALRHEENRRTCARILAEHAFREVYSDLNLREPYVVREAVLFCLENATVVKISDEELPAVLALSIGRDLPPEEAAHALAAAFPHIRLLLITCGADGALALSTADGAMYRADAAKVKVASTVGAGDSFGAAFLYWYFHGRTVLDALAIASAVGGFVVTHEEAVPFYRIGDILGAIG